MILRIDFVTVFIILAIPHEVNCQTTINTTLINQQFTCPGSEVTFTCRTTGGSSTTLAWRSVDYIGEGSLLYIAELDHQGDTRTTSFNPSIVATLTMNSNDNGQVVLESTLSIIASPNFSSSSVTCVNVATNESATSNFSVYPDPGALRNSSVVQIQCPSRCLINTLWHPPLNTVAANVTNYLIRINDSLVANMIQTFGIIDNRTGISFLLSVSSCATSNVSISTLNNCGEGPNIHSFMLNPEDAIHVPDSVCELNFFGGASNNKGSCTVVIWVMVMIITMFF